jgi:DNA-binding response OmpR family regulator
MNTNCKINSKNFVGASARHPTPPPYCQDILLADDDSYTRALNARVLSWSGYKVKTVTNGAEARKALDLQNYDLLITENEMPEMTGLELLKHLRSRGITMPVIMTSGTLPTKELKLYPGMRLEAVLLEPVPSNELLETVKKILSTAETIASGCQPALINDKHVWQAKPLASASRPDRTSLPKRILVADDEPLIRQLYTKVLVEAGYKVEVAEDGAVAWDALQANAYDLLITDNQMPKVSGIDLLEKIYAARMTLPIMMATATFPEEEFNRSPWLQPEITLLKPHTPTEFLEAVEEILYMHNGVCEESVPPPVFQTVPAANHLQL